MIFGKVNSAPGPTSSNGPGILITSLSKSHDSDEKRVSYLEIGLYGNLLT